MPFGMEGLDLTGGGQAKLNRNTVNTAMRKSPQWRQAIEGMGLNPDGPLRLDKRQQQRLAQTLGIRSTDFHIDPAGNINDYHGWKGLPTWAKVAAISGATAATLGAGGALSGGGSVAANLGFDVPAAFGGSAPTILSGAGLPASALTGVASSMSMTVPQLIQHATTTGTGKSTWDKIKSVVTSPLGSKLLDTGLGALGAALGPDTEQKYLTKSTKRTGPTHERIATNTRTTKFVDQDLMNEGLGQLREAIAGAKQTRDSRDPRMDPFSIPERRSPVATGGVLPMDIGLGAPGPGLPQGQQAFAGREQELGDLLENVKKLGMNFPGMA